MNELIYSVANVFSSTDRVSCLQQQCCHTFSIPAYQRGYKWGSEINQPVERLLNDLTKAWRKSAKEYLLQAITIKKVADEQGGWVLEVIDGQQRLTTLFILLHVLYKDTTCIAAGKLQYRIRPELDSLVKNLVSAAVGTKAEDFAQLKTTHKVEEESRQDCYYLKCAVLRCVHSVGLLGAEVARFREFVLCQVKLIVNAVEPHIRGEVIFGNLNTNRVALTETELIKGLLLTRVAREPSGTRPRRYREVLELRIQIGRQWDDLVHWSNRPEIHKLYFPDYTDGMTGLLNLVAHLPNGQFLTKAAKKGEKTLFEYYLGQPSCRVIFELLTETADRLKDWHEDNVVYHLLGYCLLLGADDRETVLLSQLKHKSKAAMRQGLYERRNKILPSVDWNTKEDGHPLIYGDGNKQIEAVFLALSVFAEGVQGRFDFCEYNAGRWSLEHIFPQTPFGKEAKLTSAQQKEVVKLLIQKNNGAIPEEIIKKIKEIDSEQEGSGEIIERVGELLQGVLILHDVGNLCLLNSRDNSAMGCAMFDGKRKIIRDRIAKGSFVPHHTYEVFSKMILEQEGDLDVWSREDIDNHKLEIGARITKLLKEHA